MYQDATQTFTGDRKSNNLILQLGTWQTEKSAWASMGKLLGIRILATGDQNLQWGEKKIFQVPFQRLALAPSATLPLPSLGPLSVPYPVFSDATCLLTSSW